MVNQTVEPINQLTANWLTIPDAGSVSVGQASWSVLLGTAFVVAVIVFGVWFLRWIINRTRPEDGDRIKVLHRFFLSPKASLWIVEVEGRRMLLGVGDGGVSLIAELGRDNRFRQVMREASWEKEVQDDFITELEGQIQELKSAIRKRINEKG